MPYGYVNPTPGLCLTRFLDHTQFPEGRQQLLVIQHDTGFSSVDLDNLTDTAHSIDLDPVTGSDIVGLVFTAVHIQIGPPFLQGIVTSLRCDHAKVFLNGPGTDAANASQIA